MQNKPVNIGRFERLISAIGGGLLVGEGLRRLSVRGLLMAGAGGALVERARSGHSRLYHELAIDRSRQRETAGTLAARTSGATSDEPADLVAETSRESFPASDPPAWTPTGTPGPPRH